MTRKEIQAQIEVLKSELGKLEELAKQPEKPKKFEFKFPEGETYYLNIGDNNIYPRVNGNRVESLDIGLYRSTVIGAELSMQRNIRANRLEMLAEYLGGLQEFKFGEENWFVFYDYDYKKWGWDIAYNCYSPERVYMTIDVAKKVARLLNSGEYEL